MFNVEIPPAIATPLNKGGRGDRTGHVEFLSKSEDSFPSLCGTMKVAFQLSSIAHENFDAVVYVSLSAHTGRDAGTDV